MLSFRKIPISFSKSKRYISGAQLIYQKLVKKETELAVIYSGGAIMPLVDQFSKGKIPFIINTHEQSGGHTATGYAKSSGKCGVGIVTSGPGLTNMVTPLLDATNDSTPFILFSGQVATHSMGSNAFQECDAVEITKPVTKWSYCVKDITELEEVIDYAFYLANDGKKGSVHLDLPKDVLLSSADEQKKNRYFILDKYDNFNDNEIIIDKYLLEKKLKLAIDKINTSKKPVLYLGQGVNDYPELVTKLVEKYNIPVTTTIHAMGVYDEAKPLSLDFLGMHGHPAANYAIQEADCIIAIGCRFDDRTTGNIDKYAPKARKNQGIIHCNINLDEINSVLNTHHNFEMDSGEFMNILIEGISFNSRDEWLNKLYHWKEKYAFTYPFLSENKINTQMVISYLNRYVLDNNLSDKTIYSSGVGNHQMMAAQFITWKRSKSFLSSGSLGVMGVGLPYAIGAQLAHSNNLVIDIDGDSSFNHTLSELKTVKEYNLPIKIAIMNDGHQSMVRAWENLFFEERNVATACPGNPEYSELAKSYGIEGIKCDNSLELQEKVKYFIEYPGPIVCDFKVQSDYCFPLVPPGAALDQMIFNRNLEIDKEYGAPN